MHTEVGWERWNMKSYDNLVNIGMNLSTNIQMNIHDSGVFVLFFKIRDWEGGGRDIA